MRAISIKTLSPKSLVLGVALACSMTPTLAADLNINGDSVNVTSGGGFNQSRVINPTTGILPALTIPAAAISGGTAIPNFTFTLESPTAPADGAYTFRAGIVIDDDNSASRLEVTIPSITMTFSSSGTVLNGSVPAGSAVTVSARASDNTTQLNASLSNGLFSFSGASLSFTAGTQVTEIQSKGGVLGNIVSALGITGAYTYAVVLKQTAGTEVLTFGTETGGFSALGCAPSGTFVLSSTDFTGGFGLQGQFDITGGAGNGAPPTQFSATCTTAISSGGSTPSPTTTATAVAATTTSTDNFVAELTLNGVSEDTVPQLTTLVADTSTVVETLVDDILVGSGSVDTVRSMSNNLAGQATAISIIASLTSSADESTVDSLVSSMVSTTNSLTNVFNALTTATTTDVPIINDTANNNAFVYMGNDGMQDNWAIVVGQSDLTSDDLILILQSPNAISTNTSRAVERVSELLESVERLEESFLSFPGITLDNTTYGLLKDLSQAAIERTLNPLGAELGLTENYQSDAATQALLSSNPALLDRLLNLVGINVGAATSIDAAATTTSLSSAGLSSTAAAALAADLSAFTKADDLSFDSGTGDKSVADRLTSSLGLTSIDVSSITGVLGYTTDPTTAFAALVKEVLPAPAALPEGTFALADGSAVIIGDGVAIVLVTTSDSIDDFALAIETVGAGAFTTSVAPNGVVSLTETASGAIFSSLFSSDALVAGTGTSETVFEAPSGDPALSTYLFVVQDKDGTRQNILPAIADKSFFESVTDFGFQVSTNTSDGTIQIDGFNFRPDYFLTPLAVLDSIFLANNADANGVAYRAVDANGDGVTDYQVLTVDGLQTVYGLP